MRACVLTDEDAKAKAEKLLSKTRVVFLATNGSHGHPNLRALALVGMDGISSLWFAVSSQSCKVAELLSDSRAVVYGYAPRTMAEFRLWGNVAVLDDDESRARVWTEGFEEYFEGKDDPDMRVLRFDAKSGIYCDKKGNGGMFNI